MGADTGSGKATNLVFEVGKRYRVKPGEYVLGKFSGIWNYQTLKGESGFILVCTSVNKGSVSFTLRSPRSPDKPLMFLDEVTVFTVERSKLEHIEELPG